MEIISVINEKGVGKSTLSSAIGNWLRLQGNKVLFIDLDAQGNLSSTFKIKPSDKSSFSVLMGQHSAKESIQETDQGDIIPYSRSLAGVDMMFAAIVVGREYKLKEAIEDAVQDYDYVIIDTPRALGTLTVNALTACNSVVIPLEADMFSMQGLKQLYDTIVTAQSRCNPHLTIRGVVFNKFNARTTISQQVSSATDKITKDLGINLFNTKIRMCSAIKEAQVQKKSIFDYAPKSNASKDFNALMEEMFRKE